MNTPPPTPLSVLRGNPTPEELAALLVVLTAVLRAPGPREAPRATGRGWGRPGAWNRPEPAAAPDAAGWQRTPAPTHGRST
ncbi:acyl-CoA carboxylase subunit epsilon [Streptomyces sp. NRRL S-340]|uniref:acyl-CoA carboxylase subunit epsilon n=1 Tax=Streptomyces sp. NRRL S-340 TaxID=1463901 RepID=UPI00055ACFA5|nr:acyl-CoA carboxylase subunit epsilon [Streptomyces sp. NRRL S-340]